MGWHMFWIALNAYWIVLVCRCLDGKRRNREALRKPDYDKIRQMEEQLGLSRSPADAPALPKSGQDDILAWGSPSPILWMIAGSRPEDDPRNQS